MHKCKYTDCACSIFSMDCKTPFKVHLTAYYKRSFAFATVKNRMPVILTKLIDYLVRDKDVIAEKFGEESKEEIKLIIGDLSKLKYEVQTNKELTILDSEERDIKLYNQYLREQSAAEGTSRYFTAIWLHAECFMYRSIKYFFEKHKRLSTFDYFQKQKQIAFDESLGLITEIADYLYPSRTPQNINVKEEFMKVMKINLWSNQCDLSITAGNIPSIKSNPLITVEKQESFLLINEIEDTWDCLKKIKENVTANSIRTVEFINDNSGYELFTDFCVADFLITHKLADKIYFNLKTIPWFVSDATQDDFKWVIRILINNENALLKKIGIKWNKYVRENVWTICTDDYWTLPLDYSQMNKYNSDLVGRLSNAILLIFKGDLNYRKLFGEINWEPSTPKKEALQGFLPTNLCIVRTLKSDIICGLPKGIAEEMDTKDSEWMISGKYGVIQFVPRD